MKPLSTCPSCMKIFPMIWYSGKKKPPKKFCSIKCRMKFNVGVYNPRWRGGRFIDKLGYVHLRIPGHPTSNSHGEIFEHRFIMEKVLGRYLTPYELVHHINGIKNDNRPQNLIVLTNSNHAKHHIEHRYQRGEHLTSDFGFKPGHRSPTQLPSGKWAWNFDSCQQCGTNKRKHADHGLCVNCKRRWLYKSRKQATFHLSTHTGDKPHNMPRTKNKFV